MIVEGRGKVAPSPHVVTFSGGHEIRTAVAEAKRRNEGRRYGQRQDTWGRGLTGSVTIPNVATVGADEAPIVAGFIGEIAVAYLINRHAKATICTPNFDVLPRGDGCIDLHPRGLGIDVKTRLRDYGKFLVRATDDYGNRCSWNCDAFVFAGWGKHLSCTVYGWQRSKFLRDLPLAPALKGNHQNVELQPEDLLPMCRLFDELEARRWL